MPTIRLATEADADQVRAIYAPFCALDSPISFEIEPPDLAEMGRRIGGTLERFPWLVCDEQGEILGYAYAGAHSARSAYQWSVNVSAYIAAGHRGSGMGRALYTSLFAILKLQGYVNTYAGITLPNPASVGIHESMGFEPVGVYREVGFKCGTWHDVGWWQGRLTGRPARPDPPLTLVEARALAGWALAIGHGLTLLRRVDRP